MLELLVIAAENPIEHVMDVPLYEVGGIRVLTMRMVTMVVVALLLIASLMSAAKAIGTGPESEGNERYITKGAFARFIEVIVVYLMEKVIQPQLGDRSRAFAPFLLTIFFFILYNNLFGLLPVVDLQHLLGMEKPIVGGTATGEIAVTAALALITFVVVQVNGIRSLGIKSYLKHYLGGAPLYLAPIMIPVEILGTIIKPVALAIRLFANMTAGHVLLATLIMFCGMGLRGLGILGGGGITVISVLVSVAIMFLELLVAFIQAFIFTFLSALFIGLLSHDHAHDDHDHHAHDDAPRSVVPATAH